VFHLTAVEAKVEIKKEKIDIKIKKVAPRARVYLKKKIGFKYFKLVLVIPKAINDLINKFKNNIY